MNTTQAGDIVEFRFFLYCLENNIPVSKPISNNLPYDAIIEANGSLLKVQIKKGYFNQSQYCFQFNTRSTSKNFSEVTTKNYIGLIDGFITWNESIPDKFLYIPIEKATLGSMTIYIGENPRSNQNYYKDFDLSLLINKD